MTYEDAEFAIAMMAGDGWKEMLDRADSGALKPTIKNAYLLLRHGIGVSGLVGFDLFRQEVWKLADPPWGGGTGPWTDADDLQARLRIGALHGVDFRNETIADAVLLVAKAQEFHPVRQYLEGLVWDDKPRLNTWLIDYLGAATWMNGDCERYLYAAGAMFLIAAVARVMEPGCKFDHVLILEGAQGLGKSSAIATLGGPWAMDTPFIIGDKDAYQVLRGKWWIEMAELDALNKTESTRSKAFFSSASDYFRPPYGRRAVDVVRQCVFAGTTNQDEYLRDSTGNRRYWPVLCTRIDIERLAADRDQLFAEALMYWREGAQYWPGPEFHELFEAQQRLREIDDPWTTIIGAWLSEADNEMRACSDGLSTAEVLRDCIRCDPSRMDERAMQMRVGKALRKLGGRRIAATSAAKRQIARHVYKFGPVDRKPTQGMAPKTDDKSKK